MVMSLSKMSPYLVDAIFEIEGKHKCVNRLDFQIHTFFSNSLRNPYLCQIKTGLR